MINLAVGLLIAALPYLASGTFTASDFPPILAYLLFPGRDLMLLLGGIVILWTALRGRVDPEPVATRLEVMTGHRGFALIALALITIVSFARVPQQEKEAEAFGGDEPKYLRIAFSLLRDTDADISGGRTETPDFSTRMQQVRNLALVGRDSVVNLFRPVLVPKDHVWNAGNWTVRGLDGGLYHLQPPGLPALVAVALGIGEALLPGRDPGIYVFVLLALVWILAARELWLLSLDLASDTVGSAVLVAMVFLSAPVYVGGYELFRKTGPANALHDQVHTTHVMDDRRRIALVDVVTRQANAAVSPPSVVTRCQLDNHLGSACVELDEDGNVLTYEEYHPYGTTALYFNPGNVSGKRYRYTGKERDEESGLYYHGARYYSAWLGRWTACDPGEIIDGPCMYWYVRCNPTCRIDSAT